MAQLKKIAPERSHIMLRSQVKPARQAEPVASSEAAVLASPKIAIIFL